MPKLPSFNAKNLIKFLRAGGFLLDHVSGGHFVFYNPVSRRRAVVPKHSRDLPKGTLFSILREAGFSRQDIEKFFS